MPDPNYILIPGEVALLLPAKCANTSIKQAIATRLGRPVDLNSPRWFVDIHDPERLPYATTDEIVAAREKGVPVVGVIRDPVARLVSCWRDKVAGKYQLEFRKPGSIHPGMSWDAFVWAVSTTPDEEADQHFRSLCADLVIQGEDPELCLSADSSSSLALGWRHLRNTLLPSLLSAPGRLNASSQRPLPGWQGVLACHEQAIYRRYECDYNLIARLAEKGAIL